MKIEKRDEYSAIKVIATLLVVIGHVTKFYNTGGGIVDIQPNPIIGGTANLIYSFHMPLFVFISGAIYSFNVNIMGKYNDIRNFLISKFKRLMIPYFIWGIGYVTPVVVLLGITKLSAVEYIVRCILLGGDSRHLWYLWTLFCIFVIAALIRKAAKRIHKGMLIMGFYIILMVLYIFSGLAPIWNILYYGTFFAFGYIFDIYKKRIDIFLNKKWIADIGIALVFGLQFILKNNICLDFLVALSGILLSYLIVGRLLGKILKIKFYSVVARDSFGIYLIHPMIIYLIFYYWGDSTFNPYIFSILVLGIVLILSCLATELIRKLHCKFLLGE